MRHSVIHNLYTGEALWCDSDITEALVKSESNQRIDPEQRIYRDLEAKRWGFFSDRPPFVDKLRTFNVFREKRLWKETPYVAMAVLQLTNRCRLDCPSCQTSFCPICRVDSSFDGEPSMTGRQWRELIVQLRRFGTRNIVFTGGDAMLSDELPSLVRHADSLGIAVQVHTTGLIRPGPDFPDVAFSILLTLPENLDRVLANFEGRSNVTVLSQGIEASLTERLSQQGWRVLPVDPSPPEMTKNTLVRTDFDRFFSRRSGDSCLNGKIYITHDGKAFPCFGHRGEPIADVSDAGLAAAVKILVDEYWNLPVDKVDPNRKCARCELRYCCTSCRYLDVDRRCGYDVDRGRWATAPSPDRPH